MKKPILTRTEIIEKEITLEEECQCSECKKIIYRQKKLDLREEHPYISLEEYHAKMNDFISSNPIDIVYYIIQLGESCLNIDDYCENCYKKAIDEGIKRYGEVHIEKVKDRCYYTEIKGDESDD